MYIPKHFEQSDPHVLHGLIKAYPLATLVVNTESGLSANHIPLRLCENPQQENAWLLQGHIALANPLWKARVTGGALAIFQGPDTYVSPGWYPSKQVHGKVVPTWNYAVVHASGTLKFIDDAHWKHRFLEKLTNDQESSQEKPWAVSDAPEAFIEKQLSAIVGLEMAVTTLCGKWKANQNKPQQDRLGVREALVAGGNPDADMLSGFWQ